MRCAFSIDTHVRNVCCGVSSPHEEKKTQKKPLENLVQFKNQIWFRIESSIHQIRIYSLREPYPKRSISFPPVKMENHPYRKDPVGEFPFEIFSSFIFSALESSDDIQCSRKMFQFGRAVLLHYLRTGCIHLSR